MSWPNPTMFCLQEPRGPKRSSGLSIMVRSPLTNETSPWMRCFPGLSGTTMVWMACSSWRNYHGQGFLKPTSTPGSSSANWMAKRSVRRSSCFYATLKTPWCPIIIFTNSGLTPTSIQATGMISSSSEKEKRALYGDYFDCVLSWWKYEDHPNVLFVKYEDMKRDIHSAIQQIGNFLDRPVSGNKLDAIVEETSFIKMKSRPLDKIFKPGFFDPNAAFFRKGEVGSYQADFTEEQNDYIDEMQHVKFHGTGITFEVWKSSTQIIHSSVVLELWEDEYQSDSDFHALLKHYPSGHVTQ